ncbi:MAG: Abi family protein [Clostridia bacterium]|nr:Abi family protein [Clostridia bacterium]
MDYFEELRKLNITFENYNEEEIGQIINSEYPFNRLMEFTTLFDKYRSSVKKGKFVSLDFDHLYSIAKIDEELSKLIFCEFSEIERTLKANLLALKDELDLPESVIEKYVQTDKEYINKVYTPENRQVLVKYSKPIEELNFDQFLDVVQFGTFQRFNSYIYNTYKNCIFIYDDYVTSALKLRNKVAHCEALLPQLSIKDGYGSQDVVAFLGRNGINHKTLTTNMSRTLLLDYCNMLYLYCLIEPMHKIKKNYDRLCAFIKYCESYAHIFSKNQTLSSVLNFMKSVVEIFGNKIT